MKMKSLVLFLTLALVSWGQTANQSTVPSDQGPTTNKCACSQKMQAGDHQACCHSKKPGDASTTCCGKEGDACCGDATKCAKPDTAKVTHASCCSGKAQCCAKGKSCCGENMKMAKMACCDSQCGTHATPSEPLKN